MNTSSSQQAATQQSQGRTRNGAYGISGKDPFGRKTAVNSNELASPNGNFANFENSFSSVPATTQDAGQFAAQNFTPFQSSSSEGYFSSPTKQTINHQISDKYAAFASVNNLFPQPSLPVTTSGSVWSVAGTVFGTSPATGSVYGTAASNPFSSDTAPTWSQPASGRCESQKFFPAANPFQGALPPPGFSAFAQTAAFDVQVPTQSINHFDQCEILASGSPNKVDFGVFTESITPNTTFQVIPGSSGMVKPSIDMSKKQFGIKNEGFNMGGTATGWPVTGINPNGDQSSGVTWNFRSGQQAQRSIFPDNKFENWPKEQFIQSSGNPFSVSSGPTQPVKLNPGNPFL
ncbi:uncharacterized protein LOC111087012 isoform X2 [Limulus polyphemus]|uniref:Uncharacterized protein LOC111087012 isoform X2 n=1 Tax=Limulus polyphemus TaxID=6850 RepID=A0ABM1SVY6_LIMPO|nr:uncharacterized protein LOC111087012 isoform X2 [Limulus polyphemus]